MIALLITLCLWSPLDTHPGHSCREIHLIQESGPFVSEEDCIANVNNTLQRWFDVAGPVFGFTAMKGNGYEFSNLHCGVWNPPADDGD